MPKRSNPFANMPMPKPRPKRLKGPMDKPVTGTSAQYYGSDMLDEMARMTLKRMKEKRLPKRPDLPNDLNFGRPPRKPHLRNA